MTEQLQSAEKKYRGIFENAISGIFQVTVNGRFISANPAMAGLMGYDSTNELMISKTSIFERKYLQPEDLKRFTRILSQKKRILEFETRAFPKNGKEIWISISAQLVEKQGEPYVEGNIINISERVQKEKAEIEREAAKAVNQQIMASIRYARTIQNSLLPNLEKIKTWLPHSFFLWNPRDLVGGDIYFADIFGDQIIIVVMDCTGHGVPGAFMTMVACSGLRKIIYDDGYLEPNQILKRLNKFVKKSLQQDTNNALSDDGLDASVCLASPGDQRLIFAGAKLPLVQISEDQIVVIKGDKQSVGYKKTPMNYNYKEHHVEIKKNMHFYMYTDGFTDQLGGKNRFPFGTKSFQKLLKQNHQKPFQEQKELLVQALDDYKGTHDRQDDITVVGFGFDHCS